MRTVPRPAAILVPVALVLAVALIIIWAAQRRLVYFPFDAAGSPADAGLAGAETIQFTTADGLTLAAWFVPASPQSTGITVIVFPGNAGNRAMRAPLAAALSARGIATLLVDYRGYGGNPGTPSESGLAADARAVRRFLETRHDVDPARIVYFGESLGSGVAVRLATEAPPLALVLRSPFTSFVDVGRFHYRLLPVSLLLRDRFASIDRIGSIGVPVLMIAGRADTIVPAVLTERLYAAAREPKRLVIFEGLDHNDEELNAGSRLVNVVVSFIEGL